MSAVATFHCWGLGRTPETAAAADWAAAAACRCYTGRVFADAKLKIVGYHK